ncbi:MAG: alpha-2-macroglobulin [Parabacteroides sp.]|nr:alpha-2-macroglobulin [Parabacteroides sp.]
MKVRAFILIIIHCFIFTLFQAHTLQAQNRAKHIQSQITQIKEQLEKDSDRLPEVIQEIEASIPSCSDSIEMAILHSMIAEMYDQYFDRNRYTISRRSELKDYIPSNIREWSTNLFEEKIKQTLELSLRPASLLQQTPLSRYNLILEKGEDTPLLRPTLYDFLVHRAIEIHPSIQWYDEWLRFRRSQPERQALFFAELAYWEFSHNHKIISTENYRQKLDSLFTQYKEEAYVAEVRIQQLQLLKQEQYQGSQAHQDSARAAIYSLCKESLTEYPSYNRITIFQNQLNEMEKASLHALVKNNVYPGKEQVFHVYYTNITHLTIRIYQSLRKAEYALTKDKNNPHTRGKLVKEERYTLSLPNTYTQVDTFLTIPMEELGLYEYEISTSNQELSISSCFSVSRLALIARNLNQTTEFLVTDIESGKPIEGATVITYTNNHFEQLAQKQTDPFGLASFPAIKRNLAVRPIFQKDTASMVSDFYFITGRSNADQQETVELALFTDRGIYRPGQTIYFKGIAYVQNNDHPHVAAARSYTVSLLDTQYKTLSKKTFQTNQFGSFDGSLTLPKQAPNGTYTIDTGKDRISIRVESYKRPTFQVQILPITEETAFDQPLQIKGKAEMFSGVALQSGKINWSISPSYFWGDHYYPFIPQYSNTQSASGTAEVDHKGNFTIPFTPQSPQHHPNHPVFFSYRVRVSLTDSKGETQEADYLFTVGNRGFLLDLRIPHQTMDREEARAIVHAQTANGKKISIKGKYNLYSLSEEPTITDNPNQKSYRVNQLLTTGIFVSGEEFPTKLFQPFPAGRYRLEVEAIDNQGQKITNYKDFILYTKEDKRPPVFMHTWVVKQQTTCIPGETAEVIFGTSEINAYVLYERFSTKQECVERKLLRFNNENRSFQIPFKETDGEGFSVSFSFVKEGKLYTEKILIHRRQPNQKLHIHTETFRNHLLPGSQEYWKFRITDSDSTTVFSEVLASMYDASLDVLEPFRWYFTTYKQSSWKVPYFRSGRAFSKNTLSEKVLPKLLSVYEFKFDRLDWQEALDMERFIFSIGDDRRALAMKNDVLREAEVEATSYNSQSVQEETVENKPTTPPHSLRENFAETAFFYPALVSNEKGEVTFGFTLPESNTTWKLQLLAHTQDLKQGYLSKEVITSKPFMITPHLPRFLRQGDKVSITAQISNQSEEKIQGKATLELFDPTTNKIIDTLSVSPQSFSLPTDSTITVSWTLEVPQIKHGVVGCRIFAVGDKWYDGEQHLIPILSDQILITESTPFSLFEKEKEVIQSPSTKGIQPFRSTLELTANPIWYALQALPEISQPKDDNILSWFASYYSNTLAYHIVSSHPHIQQMIRQWEAEGKTTTSLYAQLEKNEELKTLLLQETPWVLDAENETEQIQRLSLLLDPNRAKELQQRAMHHILEQQTQQGGWGWFKGLQPSLTFTLYLLKGMGQLTDLQAIEYDQAEKEMQIKAIRYLDQQIQSVYKRIQQESHNKKFIFSPEIIEYLYVRTLYRDIPEEGESREAIHYFTRLAKEQWRNQSLYGKGAIGWVMLRNGEKEVANQILNWFRKNATVSVDKGMYWANNRRAEHFFLSAPINTHCLLMTLFYEMGSSQQEYNQMKQWLLSQKQTQIWESAPATCQAIYVLLSTGDDWSSTSNNCSVQWGNQTYHSNESTSITGYLKIVHNESKEKDSTNSTISITKEGNAPAWGAVYRQSFQNMDQIKEQKGILNVEKKLFVEKKEGGETQLHPITSQKPLQVGDKVIVRFTIHTDRNMEYVVLKDLRAGCFEPAEQQSGVRYQSGISYYQSPTDLSENFFFDLLPQGTYILEYPVYVSRSGEYANGISTIQCLYVPEFISHTKGEKIRIY